MNSMRVEWNRQDRPGCALLTTRRTPWDASIFKRMLVRPRIEHLGRKVYPTMSPFLLTHYLVYRFTSRPPGP